VLWNRQSPVRRRRERLYARLGSLFGCQRTGPRTVPSVRRRRQREWPLLACDRQFRNCYFLRLSSHASKIGRLLGSMAVKAIPMPELGREKATFPRATKFTPACEILSLASVRSGKGVIVSTKHPNRLRSFVSPEMCFSDWMSVSSILAVNR